MFLNRMKLFMFVDSGNVLFSSASDGWAFDLNVFAKIYASKLGFSEPVLRKTLWGDFFINTKTKKIMRGKISRKFIPYAFSHAVVFTHF
jgi:ribosome assembly protein 1